MAPYPPLRAPMTDEKQKKAFTSSDDLYSSKNIGEEQKEKKAYTSWNDLHSCENIGEKKSSSRLQMHCIPVLATVLFFRGSLIPHLKT